MHAIHETNAHSLQRRVTRTGPFEDELGDGEWFVGRPFTTQLLNTYTLLVPGGEKFVIRSCRQYMDKASAQLQDELMTLFFQEGSHSREHERMLKAMQKRGLDSKVFRAIVDWMAYRFLEPLTPRKLRLATAAAIEHHNAVISTYFLEQDLLKDVSAPQTRRLFLWHFCEEIEHKETVYKLMKKINISWLSRTVGMVFSFTTFLAYLLTGSLVLSVKTGAWKRSGFWKNLANELFSSRGLGRLLVRESVQYVKPDFYPSLASTRELLSLSLSELERLQGASRHD